MLLKTVVHAERFRNTGNLADEITMNDRNDEEAEVEEISEGNILISPPAGSDVCRTPP